MTLKSSYEIKNMFVHLRTEYLVEPAEEMGADASDYCQ